MTTTTQHYSLSLSALTAQFSAKYLLPTAVPSLSLSLEVSIEAAFEATRGRRCDGLSPPLHPPRCFHSFFRRYCSRGRGRSHSLDTGLGKSSDGGVEELPHELCQFSGGIRTFYCSNGQPTLNKDALRRFCTVNRIFLSMRCVKLAMAARGSQEAGFT